MKSVKRLSRYTSILLSLLLMLSAVSPGLTALAQEKANAAPTALTYEDDSITAELKAAGGTSLPAGAALTVKALSKDSQDETEKALYAQTEAGLNAKASEQGTTIAGFTAYSITLTDQNKKDVTPGTGSFTLKVTDKNAAAPEAYKQSTDEQKSVALYQAAEAKDEQNNPVSTMEPKQEDAASINTDPDGNITGVETALTTLKPVAVTWQNPQPPQPQTAANEALSVQSSPELKDNQFKYNFEVNGKVDYSSNFIIDFKENDYKGNDINISTLLNGETSGIKEVVAGTEIPIEEFMPEELDGCRWLKATLIGPDNIMLDNITFITVNANDKGVIESYSYKEQSRPQWPTTINVSKASQYTLYFGCMEELKTIPTIDSASKGVEIQMFDYNDSLPNWGGKNGWGYAGKGQLKQDLLKRTLRTNVDGEKIPVREDNEGDLSENFSTKGSNYQGTANHLFSEAAYNTDGTFSYSSFDNYAYLNKDKQDEYGNRKFTVYQALGTPVDNDPAFCFNRGNFFPYNKIDKSAPADNNKNLYDENGKELAENALRQSEVLYKTLDENFTFNPNYWFGMVTTASFSQLKDGKYNSKDMVYNFNGDDDMWVFIDDVLVLDLGGVHDAQSGSVNFASGEVKWSNNASDNGKIEQHSGSSTIKEQFQKAAEEEETSINPDDWKGNTFADYTGHEIKIFYMERGAGASNCKMQFNLPTVPKDSVSITKEVTNVNEGAYTDVDFDFKLYVQDDTAQEGDANTITDTDGKIYRLKTDQPYDLKEGTEIIKADQKTNENTGIFTLKHGQTAYFEELATQGTKYIVQEVGVNQNQYDEIKVNGEAVNENGGNITGERDDRIIQTNPLTVGTNMIVKMQNKCDGENLHTINITKQIDGGQTSSDTFTAQVTIGGKAYTGAYTIVDKDGNVVSSKDSCENGKIELKANQTIQIEKIAAGTTFAVTEKDYDTETYKTPTYDVSNAEVIDQTDKASGKVQFGSNPQITITNHKNFSAEDLEVNKTATVDSWEDRTYDIRLEASSNLTETVTSNTPYDIVLVLDSSKSMKNKLTGHTLYNDEADEAINIMGSTYYYKTDSGIFQELKKKVDSSGYTISYEYNDADSGELVTINIKKSNSGKKVFDLTEAQKGRIYKTGSTSSDTKKKAPEEAAASFLDAVNEKSPDSRVGVVTFGDNSQIKTTKDGKTLLKVGTDGSLDQLKKWTAITPAGATAADEGMASAERVFDETDQWQDVEQKENREKLVVFFTDGVPTKNSNMFSTNVANAAVESAQSIKQNATIYSIGIFEDANSNGYFKNNERAGTIKKVDTYMKGIASPNCYMTTDNMEELKSLFGEIVKNMGKAIKGATITDVIDSRFELTEESKEALESAGAKITSGDEGTTTITWTNQTINAKTTSGKAGWAADIKVVAKADYIGGNNVSTNVAGISNVTVNGITKNFDQPTVNVKADISLLDQANTIFWDETVPNEGDLLTRIREIQQKSAISASKYGTDACLIEWQKEDRENTSIDVMTQDKPEKDTYYTVNVSYNAGAPSADGNSTANTAGNKNGDDSNNTITAQGKYDVHVVKGQLEITKTIDQPYTNIKQINANQTFVFKIERYEVDGDGNKGKLAETFYETINFNANETETEKTKLISGLKKGYYTVTEETNWSQKYELKKTEDNYTKNSTEAVDLLIGDRLREATQDNPKPEFYGLDETKLKDNSGAELPPAQQYSHFAEGSKATVEFTNKLNTNWKWLSDTAAAVNVFDGHAQ